MTDGREVDVTLALNGAEALVLFAWLARFNNGSRDFEDQAEQRVLWDLEAMLEKALVAPLRADYADLLATARERVRDNDIQ
jgi:hypothetical protein